MPTSGLRQAVAAYAELDTEIGRLIDQRMHAVCAECPKQCCRADVCRQAVETWWLRQVSRHVHGKWWPDDWRTRDECIAMTPTGCLLEAGRPAICRSFVCDRYTEAYGSLWEAVFYSFLSDLTWEVGQVSNRVHLEQIDEDDFPRYAERIGERVAAGRRQLELGRRLLDDDASDLEKHRITLRLLGEVPRFWRATTRRAVLARLDGAWGA